MTIGNFKALNSEEKKFLKETKRIAKKSVANGRSHVGALVMGTKGGIYKGVTIARTRAIGSTCSERMALDQLYFSGKEAPKTVFTIGTFNRPGWKDNFVCTPCGVCLEMFFESTKFFNISSIDLICSSWDMTKILRCKLEELFPQIDKNNWQRDGSTTL